MAYLNVDRRDVGIASVSLANKSVTAANGILCGIERDIQEARLLVQGRKQFYSDLEELCALLRVDNERLQVFTFPFCISIHTSF